MARVDTLPEILRPLMEGTSVEAPCCAVCGRSWPLNRHHVVRRGAGRLYRDGIEVPKPTIMLCGSGNASGCHGLAHQNRLHFRWVRASDGFNRPRPQGSGHWEYLVCDVPTKYATALSMGGWRPLGRWAR
jgi:hypothetical protein